jgi:hypothetical protein
MEMIPIDSTHLSECGYDEELMVLNIRFNGGELYQYDEVEQSVYEGLLGAISPGLYFRQNIKERYRFVRLE